MGNNYLYISISEIANGYLVKTTKDVRDREMFCANIEAVNTEVNERMLEWEDLKNGSINA